RWWFCGFPSATATWFISPAHSGSLRSIFPVSTAETRGHMSSRSRMTNGLLHLTIGEGRKLGKRAPKAPDPWETAAAQGAWNSFTAQQQQAMNMVGQNTPWGSLDYQQTGSTWI